jgi:hypothetical protein
MLKTSSKIQSRYANASTTLDDLFNLGMCTAQQPRLEGNGHQLLRVLPLTDFDPTSWSGPHFNMNGSRPCAGMSSVLYSTEHCWDYIYKSNEHLKILNAAMPLWQIPLADAISKFGLQLHDAGKRKFVIDVGFSDHEDEEMLGFYVNAVRILQTLKTAGGSVCLLHFQASKEGSSVAHHHQRKFIQIVFESENTTSSTKLDVKVLDGKDWSPFDIFLEMVHAHTFVMSRRDLSVAAALYRPKEKQTIFPSCEAFHHPLPQFEVVECQKDRSVRN